MTGQLAFVESPVQLLNVLEWAHTAAHRDPPRLRAVPPQPTRRAPVAAAGGRPDGPSGRGGTPALADGPGRPDSGLPARTAPGEGTAPADLTVVVLSPTDPMSRGQLRRMAQLARDEGITVKWQDARQGRGAVVRTLRELARPLRTAERVIVGDPFSRYVQLLLTLFGPRRVTVVDDGTATMEFAAQLARGERLVRWHRRGSRGPRELVLAPVTSMARRKLAPGRHRAVEIFTSLPVEPPPGTTVLVNDFSWTRSRFGPPRLTRGADLVGTSLVETGVVDPDEYLRAVTVLARTHGATRYFAHRRESAEKLHRIAVETGLEVVRPDLPLELIARRGPIGRTVVSFPSTVVHTLPLALAGTGVKVAVCEIAPEWLRENASPRAQGFLAGVAGTATLTERLEFG
ncbi:hypothetical protein [Streptomyces showdoensis]|uniref:Uncharacterized protein n=1 Tax=Streptomyces showdoensis TaxID=68268 RepID=A0A2P2GMY6_STREW|nr:hypothetical protein [Streptomyces showdoensis]KKZ72868.1 hypothetical protein VO63_16150 [Streptomyces showdoensis]